MSDTELTSIDAILPLPGLEEPKEEVKEETPEKAVEEDVAEPEKGEEAEGEEPGKPESQQQVPQQALHEEREKRRKAQEKYEALQEQTNALLGKLASIGQPNGQAKKAEIPEFSADPQGYVDAQLAEIRNLAEVKSRDAFFKMSESSAIRRHEDYDAMTKVFDEMANHDPTLRQKILEQPDPAEWVYGMAKRHEALKEVGDITTLRERTRAEIETEVRAKLEAEAAEAEEVEEVKPVPTPPKSLAAKRSAGKPRSKAFTGPTPIDDILPGG